ncbi:MAG TPA: NAD(P)-binding protein, partial [Acidimicrobiales bacterium]
MGAPHRQSVAILGGGMGALTTAFELTEGDWTKRYDRVTVYQRGWRLGGKGASSRGEHGRIEEHGLHVLLGYYDRTFDVMRRCYEELDRPNSDPNCPIRSLDDAVSPSHLAGVVDHHNGHWSPWVASFGTTPGRPGDAAPDPEGPSPWAVADLVTRSLQLLLDFFSSMPSPARDPGGSVQLSTSPVPLRRTASGANEAVAAVVRGAGLIGLTLPLSWAHRLCELARRGPFGLQLEQALPAIIEPIRIGLRQSVLSRTESRRTYELIELVTANLAGIVTDGLLTRPEGYAAIDHLDYRDWLTAHGIDPEALASPILRGMYDLVFGYEDADPARPRFSAGLGLQLATKMLMGYRGALFWKMQAGMGEVIFAPLFQLLRDRGVEFRFFHRVDGLRLSDDGRSIAGIEFGIQSELAEGVPDYDPLIRVKGLPCWPNAPLDDQLCTSRTGADVDLESFWSPRQDTGQRT